MTPTCRSQCPTRLQQALDRLETLLASIGLYSNPGKTKVISNIPMDPTTFQIGEKTVSVRAGGAAHRAGCPSQHVGDSSPRPGRTPGKSETRLSSTQVGALRTHAHQRKAADAPRPSPISGPMGSTGLASEPIPPPGREHGPATAGPNHAWTGQKAGEPFPEWQARTLREARVTLHRQGIERWSTAALASIWASGGTSRVYRKALQANSYDGETWSGESTAKDDPTTADTRGNTTPSETPRDTSRTGTEQTPVETNAAILPRQTRPPWSWGGSH